MFLNKYGVARHIYITIVKRGVVDFAVGADWTPAAGDVKISKDGGAAANVTNLPTAIAMGNTAIWDFSLTATEMQAAQVVVTVADSATKAVEDQTLIIETYGNASAEHAFDLATATVNPGAGGITSSSFAAGAVDANAIATDAIGSAELATTAVNEIRDAIVAYLTGRQNTAAGGGASTITLDASASAVDDYYKGECCLIVGGTGAGQCRLIHSYVGSTKVATVGDSWATNPDNTSVFALFPARVYDTLIKTGAIASTTFSAGAIDSTAVAASAIGASQIAANAITSAKIATDAIGAAQIAADAIGSSELATTGVNEIRDALVAYLTGRQSTAQAGAATTITLDSGASAVDSFYVGQQVLIVGGTGAGQTRLITAYVGSTKVATVPEAWATNPDNTSVFALLPNRAMVSKMLTDVVDANALKTDAVTEIQTGLATSTALATVQADTDDIQTRLPAALVSGRIDASVGAMAANTMTAAAAAADLGTELAAAVWATTVVEPTSIPTFASTLKQHLAYFVMLAIAEIEETGASSGTISVRNIADSAAIATYAWTDDGTTLDMGAGS